MQPMTLLFIMAMVFVFMAWYANYSKRDKILCRFRRANKTMISKFVRMQSRYVIFDKKKFDVIPSCCVDIWWCNGLIGMIFPQWVKSLDFTNNNRFPLDPNTLNPVLISPEVRGTMNKEEWLKSYTRSSTPKTAAQKQGMIQQFLPWASLILVVLVGFFLYNNIQTLNQHMALIENTLKAMGR